MGGTARGGLPDPAFPTADIMHPAVVGEVPSGGRASVGEDQPPPALARQVAALPGQRGDLGWPHHRVEGDEPGPLAADVADDREPVGNQVWPAGGGEKRTLPLVAATRSSAV
jgi:hypothetical protein